MSILPMGMSMGSSASTQPCRGVSEWIGERVRGAVNEWMDECVGEWAGGHTVTHHHAMLHHMLQQAMSRHTTP